MAPSSELKPKHVPPPPKDPQFNYIEDIVTKWYRSYFYFYALYRSAGPHALGGQSEAKFAHLTHLGGGRFSLAAMRYTGEWMEIWQYRKTHYCHPERVGPVK